MKNKLQSFETYRGFAALMIAAIHFNVNSPLSNHALANGLFVHFFFTLSGFVMYLNYYNKFIDANSVKIFLKKRFLRLYPLHFLFLIIFLIIELSKYLIEIKYGVVANNSAFSVNNLKTFLGNVFLIQTFFDVNTYNTPSWSISAEYYTYMLFALILFCLNKNNLIILISLLFILIFRINSDISLGIENTYLSFLDCIYCFFIGVFSCKIYFKYSSHKLYKKTYTTLTFFLLIISILMIINLSGNSRFAIPFVFGLLLIFSANLKNENILGKIICNKIFVYIGSISYSIYMCHLFVFWCLTQFLRFVINFRTVIDENGSTRLDLSTFEANLMVVTAYIFTIILSHFLYKYFEKRFYKSI